MYAGQLNPYQSPTDVEFGRDSLSNRFENFISLSVSILGCIMATLATVASALKFYSEFWDADWLRFDIDAGGVLGILTFAIAAWLLMGLAGGIHRNVQLGNVTYCKSLILIAIIAMSARLVSEPSAAWTPLWPSYALTFTAAIAMMMVLITVRRQNHI